MVWNEAEQNPRLPSNFPSTKQLSSNPRMTFSIFLFLGLVSFSPNLSFSIDTENETPNSKLGSALCPLDVDGFRKIIQESNLRLVFLDVQTECNYMIQGIRLLHSQYLRTTGYFFPPQDASEACWVAYENLIDELLPGFRIRSTCGFHDSLMWQSCLNITTRSQFETLLSQSDLNRVWSSCEQSLRNSSSCSDCLNSLSSVNEAYFDRLSDGNTSDCTGYSSVYAGGVVNLYGPVNFNTAKCLFNIDLFPTQKKKKKHNVVLGGVFSGSVCGLIGAIGVIWIMWTWHRKKRRKNNMVGNEMGLTPRKDFISRNHKLLKLTFEEIKKGTNNFSRENIIGMGGYGNVYKGKLPDGSEVAYKRFKNCSVAADQTFSHEVEVIASIRHVNLVALRGYCIETVPSEGHQRVIACDLVHNQNLYDHLFGPEAENKKLPWPTRRKIAIGVARGLAYLHYGVKPGIIHRDVKPSNILLDETFEPKLVDFGLAKFAPEGYSHVSTRVAGTLGYVAPEYALYGQLSEGSDVYSFGVVLLELLSGKKAVIEFDGVNTLLLTDWAWSLVKQGRVLDVIDEGIPELGLPDEMEKYVLTAVVSSHPIVQARPTMDQIVKILEANFPVPPIADRPFSLLESIAETELMSFNDLTYMSSPEQFICNSDHPILDQYGNGRRLK